MPWFKLLFLIRHGKSFKQRIFSDDYNRQLELRGKKEALNIGRKLKLWQHPEIIISSSAIRAVNTAEIIAGQIGYHDEIKLNKSLYPGSETDLISVIHSIDDGLSSAMVVGHNPGLTLFAKDLTGADINNIPTCGLAVILINSKNWKSASKERSSLLAFDYPPQNHKRNKA